MAVSLATAYVDVIPTTRNITANLRKELSGPLEQQAQASSSAMLGAFKKAAGAATVAFGAVQVGGFLKGAIGAASDLNETVSKSRVIFGENASAIDDWAKGAARSVGLSRQAALESAAGFGDMFSQIGFSEDAAANMSKATVQLAADLGSFNNLPTAQVQDAIAASLRGEYDSLQRVIPNISAARVMQEAMAASGKKNADALTAQEKAAATLAIITRDGARAQGDFARTSNGLANSQKIANAEFDNAKAKLGRALLPLVTVATKFLGENMTPVIITLGVVAGVAFTAWAIGAIAAAAATIAAAAPVIAIGVAIAALAAGIIYAYTHFKIFRDVVQTVGKVLAEEVKIGVEIAKIVIGDLVSIVQTVARIIGDLVRGFSALFRGDWRGAWEAFSDIPKAIIEFFVDFVKRRLDAVVSIIGDVPAGIAKAAVGMFDGIKDAFRAAINWIIDAWNGLEFKLPTVDTHIPGIGKVGGFTLGTEPKIPRLHSGGVVPGPVGVEVPIMALAGETVLPIGAGRGGVTIQHLEVRPVTMDATAPDIVNALSAKLGWKVALASRAAT